MTQRLKIIRSNGGGISRHGFTVAFAPYGTAVRCKDGLGISKIKVKNLHFYAVFEAEYTSELSAIQNPYTRIGFLPQFQNMVFNTYFI